jgi:hypothetical protein
MPNERPDRVFRPSGNRRQMESSMARLIGRNRTSANLLTVAVSAIIVGAIGVAGYYAYLLFAARFIG